MRRVVFLVAITGAGACGVDRAAAVPVVPDVNTVVLDHFDGATSGAGYGSIEYGDSVFGHGQAAIFNAGDYVRYPSAYLPQGTIEMWIKPDAASTGFSLLTMNLYNTTTKPPDGYYLHVNLTSPDHRVSITTWPGGAASGTSSVPLGEWTHIAMTWTSTTSQIYVDGVPDGPASGGLSAGLGYFYLNYWGTTGFVGMIDELHISNVARTPAEIAAHAVPEPASPWVGVLAGLAGAVLCRGRTRRRGPPAARSHRHAGDGRDDGPSHAPRTGAVAHSTGRLGRGGRAALAAARLPTSFWQIASK